MNRRLGVSVAILGVLALAGGLYFGIRPAGEAPAPAAPGAIPPAAPRPAGPEAATPEPATPGPAAGPAEPAFDPGEARFTLEGQPVALRDGLAQVAAAPGSATLVTTRYGGLQARGDLDNDRDEDLAFVVTRDAGGSGLFSYAVAAIRTGDGYRTSNAMLIGDRVTVQSLAIPPGSGELQVRFAQRRPAEPMTGPPSTGAVLLLKVTPQGVLQGLMK